MTRQGETVQPETIAGPEVVDDTEGNSMVNLFLAGELLREREHEVQRNLKAREHVIAARAARDEAKRLHKR